MEKRVINAFKWNLAKYTEWKYWALHPAVRPMLWPQFSLATRAEKREVGQANTLTATASEGVTGEEMEVGDTGLWWVTGMDNNATIKIFWEI